MISKNQACRDLRAARRARPRCGSAALRHELLNHLQYHMARAPRVTLHGVFMRYSIGVLITGRLPGKRAGPGADHRGHRLVADDARVLQIAPDVLDGTCPELLQDLLELRGLACSTFARCSATPR